MADNGMVVFDGLKFDFRLASMKTKSDIGDEFEWEVPHDEEFGRKLVAMSCNRDEEDSEFPERLQRKTRKRAAEHKHITAALVYVDRSCHFFFVN